jgi:hypothetical protein
MTKLEFCSDAYLAEARRLLARLVARHGPDLGSESFSSCVVCLDAPPHLRAGPDGAVAWTMSVSSDTASVVRGRRDDVDSLVVGDYSSSLPRARRFLSDDPNETLPEEEPGVRRTGDLLKLSPAMRSLLRAFHNQLAEITA